MIPASAWFAFKVDEKFLDKFSQSERPYAEIRRQGRDGSYLLKFFACIYYLP